MVALDCCMVAGDIKCDLVQMQCPISWLPVLWPQRRAWGDRRTPRHQEKRERKACNHTEKININIIHCTLQ